MDGSYLDIRAVTRSGPPHVPVDQPFGLPLSDADKAALAAFQASQRYYSTAVFEDPNVAPEVVSLVPRRPKGAAVIERNCATWLVWRRSNADLLQVDSLDMLDGRTWEAETMADALAGVVKADEQDD